MRIRDYMTRVSRWRGHIMGFCILCILFFHSGVRLREPWNYFVNLLWGVDIFFFCTGMGVHRSLMKNGDTLAFYKRRAARIYPAYLPVVLLFFAPVLVRAIAAGEILPALGELWGNVLMLGWVNQMDNQFNWYPQVIALFYLAAPAAWLAVRCADGKRLAALFAFFIVSQPCFFNSHFLIAWSRVPYFMMGLIAAELSERDADFKLNIPVLALLFIAGNALMYYGQRFPTEILWGYGLSWYPGLLIVPGALLLLPWAFALIARVKWLGWLNALFALLGKWSFEIFLVHLLLFGYMNELGLEMRGNLAWLAAIAVSVVLSVVYGKLVERVRKRKQ